MHQMWRLSESGPRNLGLACTDDGLLLGHTCLIERHDGRFVVRARGEIERLLKCAYDGEPPVDRLDWRRSPQHSTPTTNVSRASPRCICRIPICRMPQCATRWRRKIC